MLKTAIGIRSPHGRCRCLTKIMLAMKLTVFLLTVSALHLSAAGVSQNVSFSGKNVSIQKVFTAIEQQTGYVVLASSHLYANARPVTVEAINIPLSAFLDIVFKDQPFFYSLKSKNILLSPKLSMAISEREARKEEEPAEKVTGVVIDEEGKPIAWVNVVVKGSHVGTVTDENGIFSVTAAVGNILVFTSVGHERQEIRVSATETLSVRLKKKVNDMGEVVVGTGYYKVKERERTGSISRITSKDIEKQPVNNVLQAMQANIPGLEVIQTTGMPGGGFTIQIRGQNSLLQSTQPFYVIDGVPFTSTGISGTRDGPQSTNGASPLASINPNDIESIEVLKDADATAIYGSRGANGVILITTRKGKSGKAKAVFSVSHGIARVGKRLDMMNIDQYTAMRKEALANDKLTIGALDYDINGTWDANRNIDWQKELIGGLAPITNIQATLSGGEKNVTYLVGGAYYKEKTVFPGDRSFGRNSGNFSLQYNSDNRKFNASFDVNYSQVNRDLVIKDLTQFIRLAPNFPSLLNEKGELNWENNTMEINPLASMQQPYDAKTNNLITNALLSYNIIPDVKIKASFGYTIMNQNEQSKFPLTSYSPFLKLGSESRLSYFTNNSNKTWNAEAQADWSKKIGDGKLSMLVGTTLQQSLTEGQEIRGSGFTSDGLMENIGAASLLSVARRSYLQYRYTAVFARLNYTFLNKYIINLTGRRDGSSRFGEGNRFANFGAAGAAWVISEEDYIKEQLPFISFAKLRGSYGITGNDGIPDYGYLNLWRTSSPTYQGAATIFPQQLANPDYAWEINKKAEAALELGLLNNRIYLSASYYSNVSSSQLMFQSLAPSTGFGSITNNLPAKVGNTGWEFDVKTTNISRKFFSWSSSFNITIPRNKLINYPGLETSSSVNQYIIGMPISIIKLYNTHVDQETGLYTVEDYDKNGVIDSKDRYIIIPAGRRFYGGLQNSFSYKGIGLDFLFQFVKQPGISNYGGYGIPGRFSTSGPTSNQPDNMEDRWRNKGDVSMLQKFTTLSNANTAYNDGTARGHLASTDGSFIRLKSINLSYTLPAKIIQSAKINTVKVYLQGQNLITITRFKGLDPESQNTTRLPSLQILTAGLQIIL